MNYNIVKKICLYLIIGIFISIYLSLAFSSFVTYVPPSSQGETYFQAENHRQLIADFQKRVIEQEVQIEKLEAQHQRKYAAMKESHRNHLETVSGSWEKLVESLRIQNRELQMNLSLNLKHDALSRLYNTSQISKEQELAPARIEVKNIPFEQRLSKEDMDTKYDVYNASLMIDPERSYDHVMYIIGPETEFEKKCIKVLDTNVYIGESERSSEKIRQSIKHWKKTLSFNVVIINSISSQFN